MRRIAIMLVLCLSGTANAQYLLPWRNTCYQQQQQIADLKMQMHADAQRQQLDAIRSDMQRMQQLYGQQQTAPIVQAAPQPIIAGTPGNITQDVSIYLVLPPGYQPPTTFPIPAPAPPPVPQPQVLPIAQPQPIIVPILGGGAPQQQLPGGAPQQQLPGGPPQQTLPGGSPQQTLPGGGPQQQFGTPPQTQPLNPAPKQQTLPGGGPQQTPSGFQTFTRWRPSLRRPLHH